MAPPSQGPEASMGDGMTDRETLRVAVILPCYNEEAAIRTTVEGYRAALPDADIYVFDNNSRDRTVEVAAAAGAIVRREPMQGKGHVVRRM
jgi:glycosyltransferase involved in cell wall biosynthesis